MLDGIIKMLPRGPQIMLYSATFPLSVEEFMVRGFDCVLAAVHCHVYISFVMMWL